MNRLIDILTRLKMMYIKQRYWRPMVKNTHDPQRAQNALLKKILNRNRDTEFGRKHGFNKIMSYQDFSSHVQVHDYEMLREYIEEQDITHRRALNMEHPVMYVQTSGTTDKPKLIPILDSTIRRYRRCQHIFAYAVYASVPEAYAGKILAITSPAVEGTTESGAHYGAMSGLMYKSMPALTRKKYVLPSSVFEIADYEKKYHEITKLALAERDISLIATANPSTLLKVEQIMNQNSRGLIDEIHLTNRERASELLRILEVNKKLEFSQVWPNLKSVTTWTGGSCGTSIPRLQKMISSTTRIIELGYLSSEFRGGITIDAVNNRQIPCLNENFYEFVQKEDWENNKPRFLTLDQIVKGEHYYIFVTTQSGLYRYHINDLIEVTGSFNQTPTIRFLCKGKGVVNLTGEKLCEYQLVQAMTGVSDKTGADVSFFMMLGCPATSRYTLYVEATNFDVRLLEEYLCQLNIEFREKQNSGRLKSTNVVFVQEQTGEKYKKFCLENGQREGQFKMTYLQNKADCRFDFDSFAEEKIRAVA